MNKKISIWVSLLIALFLCLATFMISYIFITKNYENDKIDYLAKYTDNSQDNTVAKTDNNETTQTGNYSDFITRLANKLSEVDTLYRNYYINELDDDKLIDYAIAGYVAGTGDDYGAYYNTEDFKTFLDDFEGQLVGIGVNVIYNSDNKLIEVISVVKDSPAEEAGLQPGDLFYTIGEDKELVSELGYYPAIDKVRGEEGTYAVFSILRGPNYDEEIEFKVIRKQITALSVLYHVHSNDPTVGVVKITGFEDPTCSQLVAAINDLLKQGCDKFVFDLRYNPGGELNSIVTILDYILPEGPIVRIMDADGNNVKTYYSEKTEFNYPMTVLVNGSTASAAELFTSALRDYNKAKIVGTTTYGKGCMQTTIPLSDKSAVSITYRMYNPPFSDNYHGIGIVPDIVVELDEALSGKSIYKITDEEDNQLNAAVAALYE